MHKGHESDKLRNERLDIRMHVATEEVVGKQRALDEERTTEKRQSFGY